MSELNLRPQRARLEALLARLAASGEAEVAAGIRAAGQSLRQTPLRLKHYAEQPQARLALAGEARYRLATDADKAHTTAPGRRPPVGAETMDRTLFNLVDFTYFSVEPRDCGAAGKQRSRFGEHCYWLDVDEDAHQLRDVSLFTRDFAVMPALLDPLFRSASEQTVTVPSSRDGSRSAPPPAGTRARLSGVALAALYASERRTPHTAWTDAGGVYRFAADSGALREILALDMQYGVAASFVAITERLHELERLGRRGSPTHAQLAAALQALRGHLAGNPTPAALNALINGCALRPQVIVPGSVVAHGAD